MLSDRDRLVRAIEAKFDDLVSEHFGYLVRNWVDQASGQAVAEFRLGLSEAIAAREAALSALDGL